MQKVRLKSQRSLKLKKRFLVVILFTLVLCCLIQAAFGAEAQFEWKIDLKIENANDQTKNRMNVFAPFEEVKLIANVTRNSLPQPGIGVSFSVQGPVNSTQNSTQIRNVITDTQGVASFIFRIPMNNQSEDQVIGTWEVFASVATLTEPIKGNLTFEVEWPVEIKSVNVLSSEGKQGNFTTETKNVTAQLSLEYFDAEKPLVVNITGKVTDSSNNSISDFRIENLTFSNTTVQIEEKFEFASEMSSGEASAEFNVYSGNYKGINIQVAETKKITFLISNPENQNSTTPTNQTKRDIAVLSANISANELNIGETLNVTFTVSNFGNQNESCSVFINSNKGGQIGNLTISLQALSQSDSFFLWETSDVKAGTYTISVEAERLPGEASLKNNIIEAGTLVLSNPLVFPQATSLFILLLVVSGIFTATSLFLFLRRKNTHQFTNSQIQCFGKASQ